MVVTSEALGSSFSHSHGNIRLIINTGNYSSFRQSKMCKFMSKMHQNAFEGLVLSGPTATKELVRFPRPSSCN